MQFLLVSFIDTVFLFHFLSDVCPLCVTKKKSKGSIGNLLQCIPWKQQLNVGGKLKIEKTIKLIKEFMSLGSLRREPVPVVLNRQQPWKINELRPYGRNIWHMSQNRLDSEDKINLFPISPGREARKSLKWIIWIKWRLCRSSWDEK